MMSMGPPPSSRRETMPAACSGCVQNQPAGRRRSSPCSTSTSSRARTRSGSPNQPNASGVIGSSAAAAHSCGPSRCGFSGSTTVSSTPRSNTASGWSTTKVSRGSSEATKNASASWPPRPARPICWKNDARVPGQPATTTASSPATSMPISSAGVEAMPSSRPERRSASSSRRSSGR